MNMKKMLSCMYVIICSLTVHAQFSGQGSGTEKDPYQITNADQLFDVRNDLSAHYKVMNDIDLTEWIQEESPNQGWSPIGTESIPFCGIFNGNNKVIKGLYINKTNSDNIGFFGYLRGATVKNMCLLNPVVAGKNYVGAVVGKADITKTFYVENNACIGGSVSGKEAVGGIFGGGYYREVGAQYYIQGNYSSSSITGTNRVGGIIGYLFHYNTGAPYIFDNHYNGKIEGSSESIGGIIGELYRTYGVYLGNGVYTEIEIKRNLAGGSLYGNEKTNGIAGCINGGNGIGSLPNFNNNVCYLDTLSGNSPKRIWSNATSNNYGLSTMVVLSNGRVIDVDDDDYNGNSLGNKTLMRKNTYVGLGFDFAKQWNNVEGETVAFNINQSAPGKIEKFVSGSRGKISGTATGSGKVYVFVDNKVYESFIADGKWEVTLGNTTEGTVAKVSVATGGLMPSLFITAKAEKDSSTPTKISGDANGDGVVDSADVTAIINYILGKPSASFNKENADVTGDGEILIDDAVQTVQMIMDAQ